MEIESELNQQKYLNCQEKNVTLSQYSLNIEKIS